MRKALAILLTIWLMLGSVAQAVVVTDPVVDLTDCIGMTSDDYYAYLRDNNRYNPHVKTDAVMMTDDEGLVQPIICRLIVSDTGLMIHGLNVGLEFLGNEYNAIIADMTADGWAEVSREYDGNFYCIFEKVAGDATYRLALWTLNTYISSLDYSVDNLEAHFANLAAETAEE